jgi:hypothetical protein
MDKQETEVILEELEALKMVRDFQNKFMTSDLTLFCNDNVLHRIAKDCALIEVGKIITLYVTKEHENEEYWRTVKEYIEIL